MLWYCAMGNGARILLIDDDVQVLLVLEHVLEDAGYSVDTVASGREARDRIERQRYDLIVADARLGDDNGVEIADAAKAKGMRAVVLTGFAAEARSGGERHDYLFKPIRPAELVRAVARFVESAQPT